MLKLYPVVRSNCSTFQLHANFAPISNMYMYVWRPLPKNIYLSIFDKGSQIIRGVKFQKKYGNYWWEYVRGERRSILLSIAICKHFKAGLLFYPMRMRARGKAIGFVHLIVVVVTTKIARSGDIDFWATRKHNRSIEIGEKLASVCFESFGTAQERRK